MSSTRYFRHILIIVLCLSGNWVQGQSIIEEVLGIDWSPDGNYILASFSTDCAIDPYPTTLRLISVETGDIEQSAPVGACTLFSIHFSPDGTKFALGEGGSLVIRDALTLEKMAEGAQAFDNKVVAWSPDSNLIATGVMGFAVIIDSQTGEQIRAMAGDGGGILDLAWSPDGRFIASDDIEGNIRIWDAKTGVLVAHYIEHSLGSMMSLDWHPTDDLLVSYHSGSGIAVWNTVTHKLMITIPSTNGFVVRWSPDGSKIAVGGVGGVIVWDATTQNEITSIPYNGFVYTIAWSPDSTRIAYGGQRNDGQSATVEILNVDTTLVYDISTFKAETTPDPDNN